MAIVRVAIIERPINAKQTQFLVRPSVCFMEDGDVLRLLNTTNHAVTITMPAQAFDPAQPADKRSRGKLKKRGTLELALPLRGRKRHNAMYRYRITVSGTRALGDSDPVIIIDNP